MSSISMAVAAQTTRRVARLVSIAHRASQDGAAPPTALPGQWRDGSPSRAGSGTRTGRGGKATPTGRPARPRSRPERDLGGQPPVVLELHDAPHARDPV